MTSPYRERRPDLETSRYENQLRYSTQPDARTVHCEECDTYERWGCDECAEHWADYHRNEFNHSVVVFLPQPETYGGRRIGLDTFRVSQRAWWER